MTAVRSLCETVVFKYPFRIASIERLLPAGSYEVITDEELMEGSLIPSLRCVATRMIVPAPPRSPAVEMVAISSTELSIARETMRWCPENDVPVDIDKHRDMPSPSFRRMMVEIESKALRGQQPLRESELLCDSRAVSGGRATSAETVSPGLAHRCVPWHRAMVHLS